MKEVKQELAVLESLRRDKFDPKLTSRLTPEGVDYAGAGLLIDAARAALDEGIPGKQKLRVRKALQLLHEGAYDLTEWARYNGYYAVGEDATPTAEEPSYEELHERIESLLVRQKRRYGRSSMDEALQALAREKMK